MRYIIGYGNPLRGEDGFGVEVVEKLAQKELEDTKILKLFGLTPELVLELMDASKIIFIDAAYSPIDHYALAVPLQKGEGLFLSHHICAHTLMRILQELYQKTPPYEVFSILTSEYDFIKDEQLYNQRIKEILKFL